MMQKKGMYGSSIVEMVITNMTLKERIEASLKEGEYIFDPKEMPTASIREMVAKGRFPVCKRCGARLEFALTPAEAKDKRIPPGVRCPRNLNHCQIVVEFGSDDPK
jgi:hypothetical protein